MTRSPALHMDSLFLQGRVQVLRTELKLIASEAIAQVNHITLTSDRLLAQWFAVLAEIDTSRERYSQRMHELRYYENLLEERCAWLGIAWKDHGQTRMPRSQPW